MRVLIIICSIVVYSFLAHGACSSPTGTTGQMAWVSGQSKVMWCDGTNWQDPSNGVISSCSGTTAGTWNYNSGQYRYCNGTNWISMKGPSAGSCSGTAAGTMTYVAASSKYRFCDSLNWYDMTVAELSSMVTTNLSTSASAGNFSMARLSETKFLIAFRDSSYIYSVAHININTTTGEAGISNAVQVSATAFSAYVGIGTGGYDDQVIPPYAVGLRYIPFVIGPDLANGGVVKFISIDTQGTDPVVVGSMGSAGTLANGSQIQMLNISGDGTQVVYRATGNEVGFITLNQSNGSMTYETQISQTIGSQNWGGSAQIAGSDIMLFTGTHTQANSRSYARANGGANTVSVIATDVSPYATYSGGFPLVDPTTLAPLSRYMEATYNPTPTGYFRIADSNNSQLARLDISSYCYFKAMPWKNNTIIADGNSNIRWVKVNDPTTTPTISTESTRANFASGTWNPRYAYVADPNLVIGIRTTGSGQFEVKVSPFSAIP